MTARNVLRRAAAIIVLAAILAGLPAALWLFVGPPLRWPAHFPDAAALRADATMLPSSPGMIMTVARLVAWAGWAWFTAAVALEATTRRRGRRVRRIRGMGWIQALAARAVTATTIGVTGVVPAVKAAAATPVVAAAPQHPDGTSSAGGAVATTVAVRADAPARYRLYTVQRGDTLWGIAARQLGDPYRYRQIAALNLGRVMDDGRVFGDDNWIYPGWVLRIPAAVTPAADLPGAPGQQQGAATVRVAPGSSADCIRGSRPAPDEPARRMRSARFVPAPRDTQRSAVHDDGTPGGVRLPSGAIVGISFAAAVSGAILTARFRRARRRVTKPLNSAVPGTVHPGAVLSAPAVAMPEPPLSRPLAVMRQVTLDAEQLGIYADADSRPAQVAQLLSGDGLICAHGPGGDELRLDLTAACGIGFTGDGADDAVRAILCGLLLTARETQVRVLVPERLFSDLLDITPDTVPGLTVTATLEDALSRLEAGKLRRARLADEEPGTAPPLDILIATTSGDERLRSLLDGGAVAGILLRTLASGTTVHVAADGRAAIISGAVPEDWNDGAMMFQLGAGEAAEVLAAVCDADGRYEVCDPDADSGLVTADTGEIPADGDGDASDVLNEGSPQVSEDDEPGRIRPVWIRVLGPAAVSVRGEEIATGLRSDARNLLALLAVRKDGLTLDEIIDLMWPEVNFGTGGSRFHTAVKNIRGVLRATTGAASAGFVIRASGRYRLDPGLIDCDLWHFDAAITQARTVPADEREAALRWAADSYTGPLLDGCGLEWVEPCREAARRAAADMLRHLADLTWDRDPDAALGWLDRAMTIDELNEELHRHVMTRQAELGRLDAVRRTWQRLEISLAAIGETPAQDTRVLADRLTAGVPGVAPAGWGRSRHVRLLGTDSPARRVHACRGCHVRTSR